MRFTERETIHFNAPGPQNTDHVFRLVEKYAQAEGIHDIVVASTTGETGAKASEAFKGFNVVVVTHHFGFSKSGTHELMEENRRKIL